MILSSKLITGPIEEPVTLDEVKAHLNLTVVDAANDNYISSQIPSARRVAEKLTRCAFLAQTWEQYQDGFPGQYGEQIYNRSIDRRCIHLLWPPLQSVTSITYLDPGGSVQTMDPATYVVDTGSKPGRISPKIGVPWPPTARLPKAVTIRFVAGFSDTAANALAADPGFEMVKTLIMQLIGHWYANREPVVAGSISTLPLHLQQLVYSIRP